MIVYVYNIFEKLQKKLFTMHASREWNLGFLGILQPFKAGQVHSGFGQMEENFQSLGNAWHAFIQGWGNPCMLQAACHATGSSNSLIY